MICFIIFTQLKSLWDELNSILSTPSCICGHAKSYIDQQNQDHAIEFLQGLHDRFSAIPSQILLMDPFPSIQLIYNLVNQEEKQQEINICTTPTIDLAVLQASKPPFRPSGKRKLPFCVHCNKHGNTLATCYQIHGFPDKQVKKSRPPSSTFAPTPNQLTPEQYNKLPALLSKDESNGSLVHLASLILNYLSPSWIFDSGASNHICTSLSFFSSYPTVHKGISVQLPNGSHALVTHIGIVHCSSSLILKDGFHIPSFKFNLLSISQLTNSSNCDSYFHLRNAYFKTEQRR